MTGRRPFDDADGGRQAPEDFGGTRESVELAMEAAQAGHFDILLETKEAYWSPRMCAMLGITDPAFRPRLRTFSDYIHPDDKSEFLANIEDFQRRDTPLDTRVRVRHTAGHYIWVQVHGVNLKDSSGRARRIIGLIRDVSATVQFERALADSERKYRNLIEGSLQGVTIVRGERVIFCNQASARMFGYEEVGEMLALDSIERHIPAERLEQFRGDWDRALRRELDGVKIKRRILDRNGQSRWIETTERLIQWEGEPARQMVVLDVTEREAFEAKLRASEERFRLLADNASDIITLYDQDQVLRYVSPSIERVAGYKPEEVVGRDIYYFAMPEFVPSVARRAEFARSPYVGAYVWRLRRKDGSAIWVESTSTRVPMPAGEPGYAVVSALRDVTERVEREVELGAARDRLKNQAEELTELARNLEVERERAEQANAAKSLFLAMMSHELRTPMSGIMGMVELLVMSGLTPEQENLTGILQRSARLLLDHLNDILDFSKIEAGRLEIESIPFDVSHVLFDTINLFAPVASEKGVTLETTYDSTKRSVMKGDPRRLRQVLANLIGNAVKFTEAGRITIGLEELPLAGDGVDLRFSIADTGIGIAARDLAILFTPFMQADVSTQRKYGGTGLGLVICRRLIEAMGGDIKVSSEPGKGSVFSFTARVERATHTPDLDSSTNPSRRGAEMLAVPRAAVPRRILLAEDNETLRYLTLTMLSHMGHVVDIATNGAEALAAIRAKNFDVVLMDVQMPVMDGLEATRNIRRLESDLANTPIIALTADVITSHRGAYFAAGVDAIVGKPVSWAELSAEIERQLARPSNRGGDPGVALAGGRDHERVGAAGLARAGDGVSPEFESKLIFDERVLEPLTAALGEAAIASMLETFVANMDEYLEDLRAAVSAGDVALSRRAAHGLTGICAQFGAVRAAVLARFVEVEAGGLAEVVPLVPVLASTIAATKEALKARQANLGAAN